MECQKALPLMHEYLDSGLSGPEALSLKEHLIGCPSCRGRLNQLEKVEALVQAWPRETVPSGLTERVMQALPPVKRKSVWQQWFRSHPGASVAAVFVLVMMGSFLSSWNRDTELVVKGTDLQSVVIKGDTVIVPAGQTVAGNLMVENGKLQVDGDIKGNIVVIDGSVNLASTAHIGGQVTEIDQAFSWLWFKVNNWASQLSHSK
jgi:anti-sigma factor RsiW